MKEEIKNYYRQDLFNYYHKRSNPFVFVTTKIDITNIYDYCKIHKYHYATIAYVFGSAMNEIEEFKYRYENGKIYKYDKLNIGFTQMFKDGNIGYFTCSIKDNYKDFINEFKKTEEEFLITNKSIKKEGGELWVSCSPWYHFSSLVPPFDKNITIPQLIWDKFELTDNKDKFLNSQILSGSLVKELLSKISIFKSSSLLTSKSKDSRSLSLKSSFKSISWDSNDGNSFKLFPSKIRVSNSFIFDKESGNFVKWLNDKSK